MLKKTFLFALAGSALLATPTLAQRGGGDELGGGEQLSGTKQAQKADNEEDHVERRIPESTESSRDAALKGIRKFIEGRNIERDKPRWRTRLQKPPKLNFNPEMDYFWNIQTNVGEIKVRLMPDIAPMHVSSLIYLTEAGFYDGLTFHRVIPGFMAQGGCPLGTGSGNPGYRFNGEFDPNVRHDKPGLLSMANAGPGTDGSQFFLTFKKTEWLDDKHTIYGEIVEGMESTMKRLEQGGTPSGKTKRKLDMIYTSITVEPKPERE